MSVNFIYELMQFIYNKNLNGNVSPDEFNIIIEQSSLSYMDYLLGSFPTYQYGKAQPKIQFGMNESIRQTLSAFIDAPATLTIASDGTAPYPSDYQQMDAMYDATMNRIRFVPQHKLYSYINSTIDPIESNPIYLVESGGFRFYPNNQGTAKLSYVHTPSPIFWAYTLDSNGRAVYDPANSKDPAWYDVDCFEITSRALAMVGVNLQAQQVSAFANQITKTGQ